MLSNEHDTKAMFCYFLCSFICQSTLTRWQQRELFGQLVKLPPIYYLYNHSKVEASHYIPCPRTHKQVSKLVSMLSTLSLKCWMSSWEAM